MNGHLEVVKPLLQAKAEVDAKDKDGQTALDRAKEDYQGWWESAQERERIREGRRDVVELLEKLLEKWKRDHEKRE